MEWDVIDSTACPTTGTLFTCLIGEGNIKLIMWSSQHDIIKAGDRIKLTKNGMIQTSTGKKLNVITFSFFEPELWKLLYNDAICPGNTRRRNHNCMRADKCMFISCPYHLGIM